MRAFTKNEIQAISFILIVLFLISGINISASLRKGRDATRKDDLSYLEKAIDTYYQKYKEFPHSNDQGEIIGCFNNLPQTDLLTGHALNAVSCKWGQSSFEEIKTMPSDPNAKKGTQYRYISDGKGYKIYVALEGKKEAEYTPSIASMNIKCGRAICNYGRIRER